MPVRQVATVLHRGFEMVDDAKLHQFMGQMLSDLGGVRPRIEHRADTGLSVSRGACIEPPMGRMLRAKRTI